MNVVRLIRPALASLLAAAALVTLAGCAGTSSGAGSPSAGRSGVEVFGTIDAGVSGTRNRSAPD